MHGKYPYIIITRRTPTDIKCEQSVQLLKERIANIPNVNSWAKEAGVSREWLYKSVKRVYNVAPKLILREVRYRQIIKLIHEGGWEASS
jgi:AraC-like DNA-binding protein